MKQEHSIQHTSRLKAIYDTPIRAFSLACNPLVKMRDGWKEEGWEE